MLEPLQISLSLHKVNEYNGLQKKIFIFSNVCPSARTDLCLLNNKSLEPIEQTTSTRPYLPYALFTLDRVLVHCTCTVPVHATWFLYTLFTLSNTTIYISNKVTILL